MCIVAFERNKYKEEVVMSFLSQSIHFDVPSGPEILYRLSIDEIIVAIILILVVIAAIAAAVILIRRSLRKKKTQNQKQNPSGR